MNYPFYLRLINRKSRVSTPSTYEHKELGKVVSLFSDGSVKTSSRTSSDVSFYADAIMLNGSTSKTEIGEGDMPYKFNGLSFEEAMAIDDSHFIRYLAQHPSVKCDYPELLEAVKTTKGREDKVLVEKRTTPLFELVIPEYNVRKSTTSVRRRAKVVNHFDSLSEDDMAKVCWSFGVDPRNMNQDEIFDKMVGDDGVLFHTTIEGGKETNNSDVYMLRFVDKDALNDESMVKHFAVKEAMEMSKLEQSPMEYRGGNYYHEDTYIGNNFDTVFAFFENNSRLYDSLVGSRFESEKKPVTRGRKKATQKSPTQEA